MNKFNKNNKGFTLLELIIVMAIIGILAAGVLLTPGILDNRKVAVDTANYNTAVKLQQEILSYFITTGTRYAPTSATLNMDDLKAKKIISSDTNITGTFILVYTAEGTPNVGFTLTSDRLKANSKCYTISGTSLSTTAVCSDTNYFFAPASNKLGSTN